MSDLPIDSIVIGERHRRDLGDLSALADSIVEVGLLHPVVVTSDHRLVAGERRLAAMRHLGCDSVPVTIATSLDDATDALRAERDENTCRLDMSPVEKESLAQAIVAIEAPKAAERERAGRPSDNLSQGSPGRTRTKAAKAVGMSEGSLSKVTAVRETAEDDTQPEPVRAAAVEALAEIHETGKVDRAYKKAEKAKADHLLTVAGVNDDADLARARLRSNASKQRKAIRTGLLALDPERVGLVTEADEWTDWSGLRGDLDAWFDRVMEQRRTGLEIVG